MIWMRRRYVEHRELAGRQDLLQIWRTQLSQAFDPHESSTHRKPPLRKYSRRRRTSSGEKRAVPMLSMKRSGQRYNKGSVSDTTTWCGCRFASNLTGNPRQLGETNGEVVVGAGIVGGPSAAEEPAAEHEGPIEVVRMRPSCRHTPATAHPDLLCAHNGHSSHRRGYAGRRDQTTTESQEGVVRIHGVHRVDASQASHRRRTAPVLSEIDRGSHAARAVAGLGTRNDRYGTWHWCFWRKPRNRL